METARYQRLDQLPDPDIFELELDSEKIYHPPPTRAERLRKWARRHLKIVVLVLVFFAVAILYAGIEVAARPKLRFIGGHPDNASLKALAEVGGPSPQLTVTGEDQTTVTNNGNTVTIDVAGSDVIVDGKENSTRPDPGLTINVPGGNTAPTKNTTAAAPAPPKPTGDKPATAGQDNGQVSINDAPAANKEPVLPISALFYSGSEGPKACRGHVIAAITMPKQAAAAGPTAAQCYNFPNQATSGCANFVANKEDGCIAQVFAETNCRTFMNTAAFMAEDRPVGGNWKSVRVQCGIPEPDPATLGKPPMMDAITSMKDNDKAKGGR